MDIKIGQHWISELYPHESFIIYDGISEENIIFWRRSNSMACDIHSIIHPLRTLIIKESKNKNKEKSES